MRKGSFEKIDTIKAKIEDALSEFKSGKMLILMDAETRENEGDLIIAAEKCRPKDINFMVTHAKGYVCLSMSPALIDRMNLPMMVHNNKSNHNTPFTITIEANAKHGIKTGISAKERATTINVAVKDNYQQDDIVSPGHINPLRAHPHGVLGREGQTEGTYDIARLSHLKPAGVLCEILKNDGTMARLTDLRKFSQQHDINIITVHDLIRYRLRFDNSIITKCATMPVSPLASVTFFATTFDASTHMVLIQANAFYIKTPTVFISTASSENNNPIPASDIVIHLSVSKNNPYQAPEHMDDFNKYLQCGIAGQILDLLNIRDCRVISSHSKQEQDIISGTSNSIKPKLLFTQKENSPPTAKVSPTSNLTAKL